MGQFGSFGVQVFSLLTVAPFGVWLYAFDGEFDPGSGRTLAACLTHASRTERPACGCSSGERVSNTWVTCPNDRDNPGKPGLIPNVVTVREDHDERKLRPPHWDGPAAH